jgi:hypothetical protein
MKLCEAAALIRSKNAGPFWMTIDIMFKSADLFDSCRASNVITAELISAIYDNVSPDDVQIYAHRTALAMKVSFPRQTTSGSARDSDVFGGQQYAPILEIEW